MTSNNAPTIWPCLSYRDADAAIDFLRKAFGFEETLVVRGDDDRAIHHAELRGPEGGGVMLGSFVDGAGEFAGRPPGTDSVYVVTDEPDALFDRAKAAGAVVVRDIGDEDYGNRDFVVRDPEGNLWCFGTYRGA